MDRVCQCDVLDIFCCKEIIQLNRIKPYQSVLIVDGMVLNAILIIVIAVGRGICIVLD